MIKCLDQTPNCTELVRTRFRGLEANGSDLSPEELDDAATVYSSPADEWADDMMRLYREYGLKILGGCCGTDHNHMEQLAMRVRAVYDELGIEAP
jgi:methionine synthase I (cobalamin-dependent)